MEHLLKYCNTDNQKAILKDYLELGSYKLVAEKNGLNKSTVGEAILNIKKRAAKKGESPEHNMIHAVPDPFQVKGVSTMYGPDGEVKAQWVKSTLDNDKREEILRAALEAMKEDIPRVESTPAPPHCNENLCTAYTLSDYHFGALAWPEETGEAWDLKIAEDLIYKIFERAVVLSPDSDQAVLNILGDHAHFDGLLPVTPTNKHVLDADSRFRLVVRTIIRTTRKIVDMLLSKHQNVHIIYAEGNHDQDTAHVMSEWLPVLYENEPRISVSKSVTPYHCFEFGKTSVFAHHGHVRKPNELPLIIASNFPEVWGRTKYRYCHCGHQHHEATKENHGITTIQHRTLAARDAHSARGGYVSGRSIRIETYHKLYGRVPFLEITPEMVLM